MDTLSGETTQIIFVSENGSTLLPFENGSTLKEKNLGANSFILE